MTKRIPIEQLKPGMVIIKVTQQNGPVKIKKSGVVNSDDMVKALTEMGVQEIEIDPDMTVEIKQPTVSKSKTQQLLEDTTNYKQNIDEGLSEQFNRSLFLPSVQELPEAWQYYGKKTLVAGLVVLGGFSIGWVLANVGERLNWQDAESIVAVAPPVVIDPTIIEQSGTNQSTNAQPSAEGTSAEQSPQQSTNADNNSGTDLEELDEAEVRKRLAKFEKEKLAELEAERNRKREEQALIAKQLEAQQAEQEQQKRADIPPDLLRRFQSAMESIGDDKPADPAIEVQPIKDVPAVADLPPWALTQLPSLAFSAHMYVSAPEERWVRVNGKRIVEGQEIEDGLVVVGIEPQHVIMSFRGQEFSMDALSDW